jgi:hypothetical protein
MSTDKRLLRVARRQRANNVNAEAMVWRIVRGRRCGGAKFPRQVPLGRFVRVRRLNNELVIGVPEIAERESLKHREAVPHPTALRSQIYAGCVNLPASRAAALPSRQTGAQKASLRR